MTRSRSLAVAILSVVFLSHAPSLRAAEVNDKAPAFDLVDLNGAKASFKGGEGVTFINFWATWCGPCVAEFPKLNELAAEYKGKVRVIAISVDEENAKTKVPAFLKKRAPGGVHATVLLDEKLTSAEAYGVDAMPTSYVIDKKGVVRFKHVGFDQNDPVEWRKEIDSLLK